MSSIISSSVKFACDVRHFASNGATFKRITLVLPVDFVQSLCKSDCFVVDSEINRPEVKNRNGTAELYKSSADDGLSLGQFSGYMLSLPSSLPEETLLLTASEVRAMFSVAYPVFITEAGHRTRWLRFLPNMVSDTPISITFLVSDNVPLLKAKVQEEFGRINLNVCAAKSGEILRALSPEANRKECVDMFAKLIKDYFPKQKDPRSVSVAMCSACVNTLATKDFSKLHLKDSVVVDSKTIAVSEAARDYIQSIANMLEEIFGALRRRASSTLVKPQALLDAEVAYRSAKKGAAKNDARDVLENAKTLFKETATAHKHLVKVICNLTFNLHIIGPILYGLVKVEKDIALNAIHAFFSNSTGATEWENNLAGVIAADSVGRSYTESRYKAGWANIMLFVPPS